MKKILFISALLFSTLVTNAQKLEGVWQFEKMKLFGSFIYFDDSNKDKENFIKAALKNVESGMASEKEKENWKKQINENKALMYASGKNQYKNNIEFKGGKLIFKYLNDDDKIEKTEAELNLKNDILKVYGVIKLHDIYSFRVLVKANKLVLTEIEKMKESDEELIVFFYDKK